MFYWDDLAIARKGMVKRNKEIVEVVNSDLRALLFWAAIGMRKSRGGAYEDELPNILTCYAKWLDFKFEKPPKFGADLKSHRTFRSRCSEPLSPLFFQLE